MEPLLKALMKPPSRAFPETRAAYEWQQIEVRETQPTADGVHVATKGQLFIIPICEGAPASEFKMRVWSYLNIGAPDETQSVVWLRMLIAEFDCVAGEAGGLLSRRFKSNEFMCSSITLTRGSIGTGTIFNDADGSWVTLDQNEAKLIQFDFKDVTGSGNAFFIKK